MTRESLPIADSCPSSSRFRGFSLLPACLLARGRNRWRISARQGRAVQAVQGQGGSPAMNSACTPSQRQNSRRLNELTPRPGTLQKNPTNQQPSTVKSFHRCWGQNPQHGRRTHNWCHTKASEVQSNLPHPSIRFARTQLASSREAYVVRGKWFGLSGYWETTKSIESKYSHKLCTRL